MKWSIWTFLISASNLWWKIMILKISRRKSTVRPWMSIQHFYIYIFDCLAMNQQPHVTIWLNLIWNLIIFVHLKSFSFRFQICDRRNRDCSKLWFKRIVTESEALSIFKDILFLSGSCWTARVWSPRRWRRCLWLEGSSSGSARSGSWGTAGRTRLSYGLRWAGVCRGRAAHSSASPWWGQTGLRGTPPCFC